MPLGSVDELAVRHAAIAYVNDRADRAGGVVTRAELEAFTFAGRPLKLIDASRGIRNPRELSATLTILSQPKGPYGDLDLGNGLLRYAYRAGPIDQGDNVKLRRAAELGVPLILLRGIAPSIFVPVCPVYVVDDRPHERCVEVAVDETLRFLPTSPASDEQRRYVERLTKLRLHQPVFRAQVLRAYGEACSMCRRRHPGLLDAAHILPDTHPLGQPVIPNGLALCKIHHAAYDQNILGVRPDLIIEVQPKVLAETDGPMLRHGLQGLANQQLLVPQLPRERPDAERLAERYAEFRLAG